MTKNVLDHGTTKKMELLAPAGSWEALVAAVANGADAVYLGGTAFSARQYADNFGPEELIRAFDYAHVRGVKVFVTANTLVKDAEMPEALEFLRFLYEKGADGVILQDIGLARLAGLALPELRLHASTQMTVHNLDAARLLEGEGFARIVLSREMSLENVTLVAQGTAAEIEVFVHGALCVSYSGQCLMSSLIGGRSGNRGRCAQPCRLGYALIDEAGREVVSPEEVGKHLLSPKDLNMVAHLPELARAGVHSLKIEGRMKRPEYVATVARVYREALDRYYADPEAYQVTPEEQKELAQIFNRGFTTGYFFGHPGAAMMSYKRPNNRGIRLGRVARYDAAKKRASVTLEDTLRTGDGIEIWVTRGGRQGITVHRLWRGGETVEEAIAGETVEVEVPGPARAGDRIFKTHDRDLMARAQASFTSPREMRQAPVDMKVAAALGKPLRLTVSDGISEVTVETAEAAQEARNRALTREVLEEQLGRLGNAPFRMGILTADIGDGLMVPLGEINRARRDAVETLSLRRAERARKSVNENTWKKVWENISHGGSHAGVKDPTGARAGGDKTLLVVAVADSKAAVAAAEAGADIVCLGGENYRSDKDFTVEEIRECRDLCRQKGCLFYLSTPRLIQDDEQAGFGPLWAEAMAGDPGEGFDGILLANLGFLGRLVKPDVPACADYPLNIFNSSAIRWFAEKGIARVVLSPELNLQEIQHLAASSVIPVEVMVHGAVPMMATEYCVTGSLAGELEENRVCRRPCRKKEFYLRDRLGLKFPLRTDQYCHSYIFNPKTLDTWEEIPALVRAGVSALRLELKIYDRAHVARVVSLYRRGLDAALRGQGPREKSSREVKAAVSLAEIEKLNPQGLTKGHFFRGV